MDFNDTLYKAIKNDGRSLRQLAKEAECDVGSLSRFCCGIGILSTKILNRLIPILGLRLSKIETPDTQTKEAS